MRGVALVWAITGRSGVKAWLPPVWSPWWCVLTTCVSLVGVSASRRSSWPKGEFLQSTSRAPCLPVTTSALPPLPNAARAPSQTGFHSKNMSSDRWAAPTCEASRSVAVVPAAEVMNSRRVMSPPSAQEYHARRATTCAPRYDPGMGTIRISDGPISATIEPEVGAAVTGLAFDTGDGPFNILRPTDHAGRFTDSSMYLMAPWTNRIAGAAFEFQGKAYRLRADWDDGSAIHGDVKARPWRILD